MTLEFQEIWKCRNLCKPPMMASAVCRTKASDPQELTPSLLQTHLQLPKSFFLMPLGDNSFYCSSAFQIWHRCFLLAKFNSELCWQWSLKNVILKLPHCDREASVNQGLDHVDLTQCGTYCPFDKSTPIHSIVNFQRAKMATKSCLHPKACGYFWYK